MDIPVRVPVPYRTYIESHTNFRVIKIDLSIHCGTVTYRYRTTDTNLSLIFNFFSKIDTMVPVRYCTSVSSKVSYQNTSNKSLFMHSFLTLFVQYFVCMFSWMYSTYVRMYVSTYTLNFILFSSYLTKPTRLARKRASLVIKTISKMYGHKKNFNIKEHVCVNVS